VPSDSFINRGIIITYSPFLCRALPRNGNGRHRRPTFVALVYIPEYIYGRSVTHTFLAPIHISPLGSEYIFPQFRFGLLLFIIKVPTSPSKSMVPVAVESIRWVIPRSHVRVFARRLGR
jgi:hypothetical protein